jgi:hypothetical protein
MITFREKMIKLCDPKDRLVVGRRGELLPYWCLRFGTICSSKNCKLEPPSKPGPSLTAKKRKKNYLFSGGS